MIKVPIDTEGCVLLWLGYEETNSINMHIMYDLHDECCRWIDWLQVDNER